jgi:hypothetical protein
MLPYMQLGMKILLPITRDTSYTGLLEPRPSVRHSNRFRRMSVYAEHCLAGHYCESHFHIKSRKILMRIDSSARSLLLNVVRHNH